MAVFTINLTACSINRLPAIFRLIAKPDPVLDDSIAANLSCVKKAGFKHYGPEKEKGFAGALEIFLKKPVITRSQGQIHFFVEKGRFSRFAFYVTHLGMLIIIIGVILGVFGYQGHMQISEGQTLNSVVLRKSGNLKELSFGIRCDKFEISFYDKKNMPKDYKSTLTVIENGEPVLTKIIEVNDPLIYEGIYFYQSSYGTGAGAKSEMLLKVSLGDSDKGKKYRVKTGDLFVIEGTKDKVRVNKLVLDFTMNSKGQIVSRSSQPNNPAVSLTVFPAGKEPYETWLFANFPDFHKNPSHPYDFSLENLYPSYYTGLQVTRDPGVEIVWLGCFLLTAGIFMAFFMSHRRIWLRVEEDKETFKVLLAGSTNKDRETYAAEFNKLFEKIKTIGKMQ